jgi:hypothetical protein
LATWRSTLLAASSASVKRVHVRDGHADPDGVSGEGVGDGQLIQIAGVIVVDGRPREVRQVANLRGVTARVTAGSGGRRHRPEFGRRRRWKGGEQASLEHRPLGNALQDRTMLLMGVCRHRDPSLRNPVSTESPSRDSTRFGIRPPKAREALRSLQELDDLLQLADRLVCSADVLKGYAHVLGLDPRSRALSGVSAVGSSARSAALCE